MKVAANIRVYVNSFVKKLCAHPYTVAFDSFQLLIELNKETSDLFLVDFYLLLKYLPVTIDSSPGFLQVFSHKSCLFKLNFILLF